MSYFRYEVWIIMNTNKVVLVDNELNRHKEVSIGDEIVTEENLEEMSRAISQVAYEGGSVPKTETIGVVTYNGPVTSLPAKATHDFSVLESHELSEVRRV